MSRRSLLLPLIPYPRPSSILISPWPAWKRPPQPPPFLPRYDGIHCVISDDTGVWDSFRRVVVLPCLCNLLRMSVSFVSSNDCMLYYYTCALCLPPGLQWWGRGWRVVLHKHFKGGDLGVKRPFSLLPYRSTWYGHPCWECRDFAQRWRRWPRRWQKKSQHHVRLQLERSPECHTTGRQ